MPVKSSKNKSDTEVPLTPSEVKRKAREFFYKLMEEGQHPWPNKFLESQGFSRHQCTKCHKYFWTANPNRTDCGDSTCAGGYSFIHPDTPPEHRLTYLQAWKDFEKSLTSTRIPHHTVPRYPVVARWRSDVDFVAAGIYCYQPFCVSGESDPPENPLIQCEFCLRFNDLDNIGKTGRHYSGFNMLGIQVFNHANKKKDPQPPYGETEEIFWKDTCIENNYRWCIETLHLKKEDITFIEDVWQGGGNCGACIEYFCGGLEIGNMVFTEYAVSLSGEFTPIETKVIDVGIGLERIPWLVNGGWTSYLDVFDYMLPELGEKLGVPTDTPYFRAFSKYTALFDVDENENVQATWKQLSDELNLNVPSDKEPSKTKLQVFKEELNLFSELAIVCDHTRTVLFAIEDGALPSNVGGCNNIRNILRRVFSIIKTRGWLEKLGGVDGIIELFKMHAKGLSGFVKEFKNLKCLETVIKLEYQRWETGKVSSIRNLQQLLKKKQNNLDINDWILCIESFGLDPKEISEISKAPIPDDLWLKFDEHRFRTMKFLKPPEYNVSGIPPTIEHFNESAYERVYEWKAKIVAKIEPKIIVCDETILNATQGGQQHDEGSITIDGHDYIIEDIEKVTNVVLFHLTEEVPENVIGKECIQHVDKEVRETLRLHHTATHVIAAAARKVLGPHVWQNGAKKTKFGAHIDLTHFELPSFETLLEIERTANLLVFSNAKVHKQVFTRKEAESKWGFVLYQGGAIPGNQIRVVDIEGIDTEACCGTHVDNLSEIGIIKITNANKVSDGVFRVEFVAGKLALQSNIDDKKLIHNLMSLYKVQQKDVKLNAERFFLERNSLDTQNKKLVSENLRLAIELSLLKKTDKILVRRLDNDPTIYIKGIEQYILPIADKFEGKNIIVIGNGFFYGLVQSDLVPKLEDSLKNLKEKGQIKSPKNTKSKIHNVIGFGYLNVQDEKAIKSVQEILLSHGFIEE